VSFRFKRLRIMAKKYFLFLVFISICLAGIDVRAENPDKSDSSLIRITPPAPKISDSERQTELAARRAKVFAEMTDKSMLILFSTEPRVYTNDVDFMYRQENNLYYLTALKKNGATLVLYKDGNTAQEILFLP